MQLNDAELAKDIVEDFVNAAWEERYPDIQAFRNAWDTRVGGLLGLGPHESEFDMGIDNSCDVTRNGTTVTVSHIRSAEIGGILKLMLLQKAAEIKVTGTTGP
jgi:hypothetical protein